MTLNLTRDGGRGVFYTIQGEGKYAGTPSVFIRLSGCNLRCEWRNPDGFSTKCDTPYSSFEPETNPRTVEAVLSEAAAFGCRHAVVTGGEPFIQESAPALIDALVGRGFFVTVETNGTVYRETKAQFISISPKLDSSRIVNGWKEETVVPEALASFVARGNYQVKFVVNQPDDFSEILALQKRFGIPAEHIFCMPQGATDAAVRARAGWITETCKEHGFSLSPRLHLWLWGDRRGT